MKLSKIVVCGLNTCYIKKNVNSFLLYDIEFTANNKYGNYNNIVSRLLIVAVYQKAHIQKYSWFALKYKKKLSVTAGNRSLFGITSFKALFYYVAWVGGLHTLPRPGFLTVFPHIISKICINKFLILRYITS